MELAGCAILKNNKILLLKRKKTGWYELPGGKVEQGETPEETAVRELHEELLCKVNIIKKLGVVEFEQFTYHWFLATLEGPPKLGEPEKYEEYRYIPITELEQHKLSPNMRSFVTNVSLVQSTRMLHQTSQELQ